MSAPAASWLRGCLRKKRYSTGRFALKVAARMLRDRGVELRAYFCSYCGGWHLTSKVDEHERK